MVLAVLPSSPCVPLPSLPHCRACRQNTITISATNATDAAPLLTITNSSRAQLDAFEFASKDGVFVTINAAGGGVPFSVLVTTTATCAAPLMPVSIINAMDLGSTGLTSALANDAGLTLCINSGAVAGFDGLSVRSDCWPGREVP